MNAGEQGMGERGSGENLCRIAPDGPFHLTGRIRIELADGAVEEANEAFLCRCGASRTKPFCDDSHHGTGFADLGVIQGGRLVSDSRDEAVEAEAVEGEAVKDGAVKDKGAEDETVEGAVADQGRKAMADPVTIVCATDGPLLVRGPLTVVGEDGGTSRGSKGALCRCGESSAKPFCDGSHRGCGFRAD